LQSLFPGFVITDAKETMLGGNQWKVDSNRLVWNNTQRDNKEYSNRGIRLPIIVELKPMEIRTFVLTLSRE